jgi:hypothetical protein
MNFFIVALFLLIMPQEDPSEARGRFTWVSPSVAYMDCSFDERNVYVCKP